MIHIVAAIALLALLYPLYSLWVQYVDLKYVISVALNTEVYRKLHSTKHVSLLNNAQTLLRSYVLDYAPVGLAGIAVLFILWLCAATATPLGMFVTGLAALGISGAIVMLWTLTSMPVWLFNFKIDVLRMRDTINMERISKRLMEVADQLIIIEASEDPAAVARVERLNEECRYLLEMADVVNERLRNIPQRIADES